jgi:signal transduction histidine kinase
VEQQLKQKNIVLKRDFRAVVDLIQADANQLQQAFINFLLNAIDSMFNGGQIHVVSQETRVTRPGRNPRQSAEEIRAVRVSISDTGEGIRKEDLASIFDPFYTTKSHGTGLGLTVAHGIIQDHGGFIDVESELRIGTTFHVSFPLIAQEAVL